MLGAVAGDADGIGFLKSVGADQRGRNLTGDDDHRNGIEKSVGNSGHGIGRSGTGGDEHHARLAGGAGVALGGMCCACFVADEDVANALIAEQFVIDGQDCAAGIAEHIFDALIDQAFHQQGGSRALRQRTSPRIKNGPRRIFASGRSRYSMQVNPGSAHFPYKNDKCHDQSVPSPSRCVTGPCGSRDMINNAAASTRYRP